MCDTFLVMPSATADGSLIFGKNSDREPNEAMALEYHPPAEHRPGQTLSCTHLDVPQVPRTLGVLICRPWWMWGAEMGANEKGVVIGNEAVFTRMPLNRRTGLTGMDLIRLALERSDTADRALEVMTDLMARHGQGGPCTGGRRRLDYHSSFLICDPARAWVLETAGIHWAARRVHRAYAISNCLTIGAEYDLGAPGMIDDARSRGLLKKGREFNFAEVFSNRLITRAAAAERRLARVRELLSDREGRLTPADAVGILSDHGQANYNPANHLLGDRICAHAANGLNRHFTQTTGSLIAHLGAQKHTYWATGTAAPCLSLYKPIRFGADPLPDLGPTPGRTCDPRSLWWRHEVFHRSVLKDYKRRSRLVERERKAFQDSFFDLEAEAGPGEIQALTKAAFLQADQALSNWTEAAASQKARISFNLGYWNYWRGINRAAGLETV